jgi:hypothetical protein
MGGEQMVLRDARVTCLIAWIRFACGSPALLIIARRLYHQKVVGCFHPELLQQIRLPGAFWNDFILVQQAAIQAAGNLSAAHQYFVLTPKQARGVLRSRILHS